MRIVLCLIGLVFLIPAAGCTLVEDDYTPPGVYGFLSDAEIAEMNGLGMPIYVGSNPPYATGTFYLDSLSIIYDDGGATGDIGAYYIDIVDEGGDYQVSVCEYTTDSSASACSVEAYISGFGDCFTIYSYSAGRAGNCEHDDINVYSGCFDAFGDLLYFHNAFFPTAHAGECGGRLALGHLRIVSEMDDYSEWIE